MYPSRTMGHMDTKASKTSRARTPSPSSEVSDDINFTGCENARKIFMALRGKPIPDVKKRDKAVSISGSTPKTDQAGCLSSPASSGERGRASMSTAQVAAEHLADVIGEEEAKVNLFRADLQVEEGPLTQRPVAGLYKISKNNKPKGYSPGSRYDSSFVQFGTDADEHDPFGTPTSHPKKGFESPSYQKPSPFSTPSDKPIALRPSTNWRSDSSGSSCSEKISDKSLILRNKDTELSTPAGANKTPVVSSDNAQAIYPPSACVFVANLLQTEDELQLKVAVTQVFREFGIVFVKIRRDAKNMPFAFCQYTNDNDAAKAILYGKGRLIHGRPCRTEKAKARRTFYISRRYSPRLTEDEARAFLEKFGEIERLWEPERHEITQLDLDEEGFFVQFTFFESGREALAACRDHDTYYLKPIDNKETSHYISTIQRKKIEEQQLENWLDRYGQDTRSIFVGNLPQRFTEAQLQNIFFGFGEIIHVTLFKSHSSRPGLEYNVFGFVEFDSPGSAQRAIAAKHGVLVDGEYLKVVQKNSDHKMSGLRRRSSEVDRTPRHGGTNPRPVLTPVAPPNVASPYPYGYPTPYSGPYPQFIPPPYYPPYPPFWNGSPSGPSPGSYYGGYGYHDCYTQQAATHAYYPSPVSYNPPYPPHAAGVENAPNGAGDVNAATEETRPQTK